MNYDKHSAKHSRIYSLYWFSTPRKERNMDVHRIDNRFFNGYWNLFRAGYNRVGIGFPHRDTLLVIYFGIGELVFEKK